MKNYPLLKRLCFLGALWLALAGVSYGFVQPKFIRESGLADDVIVLVDLHAMYETLVQMQSAYLLYTSDGVRFVTDPLWRSADDLSNRIVVLMRDFRGKEWEFLDKSSAKRLQQDWYLLFDQMNPELKKLNDEYVKRQKL